jgi:integrase
MPLSYAANTQQETQPPNAEQLRFHDLRHCCASLLLAQHVSMRVVMEILGHSQISLTMGTYSHVMPALQHEAASLMDAILTNSQ